MDESLYYPTCTSEIFPDGRLKNVASPAIYEDTGAEELKLLIPLNRFKGAYRINSQVSLIFRYWNGVKEVSDAGIYIAKLLGYDEYGQISFKVLTKQGDSIIPRLTYQLTIKDYSDIDDTQPSPFPEIQAFSLEDDQQTLTLRIANATQESEMSVDLSELRITNRGDVVQDFSIDNTGREISLVTDNQIGINERVVILDPEKLRSEMEIESVNVSNPSFRTMRVISTNRNATVTNSDVNVQDWFDPVENRVSTLEPLVAINGTNITTLISRADANDTLNTTQNNRLTSIEGVNATQDTDITTLISRADANDTLNTTQNTRLTNVEGVNTTQATQISDLQTRATNIEGVNTTQGTAINTLISRADANDTLNTTQNNRLTAEEAATAQAILRDGGLAFLNSVAQLSPDISLLGQDIVGTDMTTIFRQDIASEVVNSGSSLGTGAVITNSSGKRALRILSGNFLKFQVTTPFNYNTGTTIAMLLGDLKYLPSTSPDWHCFLELAPNATPAYNQTTRFLYGNTFLSNLAINGDAITAPFVSTPEFENYTTGVMHMIIFRFLGNTVQAFLTRGGTAAAPTLSTTNAGIGAITNMNYVTVNAGLVLSRTGNLEVGGIYMWRRALSDSEINLLRVTSDGYTDVNNYIGMSPPTYPKIRIQVLYTPSTSEAEPNRGKAVFELTTRPWISSTLIGGTLNTTNGTVTITRLAQDSTTATKVFRISAMASRADNDNTRLQQMIYLNGVAQTDMSMFITSCSQTGFISLKKNDTVQLRYRSGPDGAGGNANGMIFSQVCLFLEEI